MDGRVIFLLEEPSMKILLEGLLPRIFPGLVVNEHFQCVPHEGKSDLDISIPRKLSAWREPGVSFVIVRDNDCAHSGRLTNKLHALCRKSGRPETLIQLVCQELESWYIGDLDSLATAFDDDKLKSPALRKRFAIPDDWQKPSDELHRLIPGFQKGSGARVMAKHLTEDSNKSKSYNKFIDGIRDLLSDKGHV